MHRFQLIPVFSVLTVLLSGCLKPGLRGVVPYRAEMDEADVAIRNTALPPSRNLSSDEWKPTLDRVIKKFKPAAQKTCFAVRAMNCDKVALPASLVNNPTINAYVDANHNIFFHTGLLTHAASDEEIGAVLAHEYGHVFAGHIEKSETNAAIGGLVGIVAGTVIADATGTSDPQIATDIIADSMVAGRQSGSFAFSAEYELEADYYAALILKNAGTDLEHGKNLLVRLARTNAGSSATGSSGWGERARLMATTHPADDRRIARWMGISRTIADSNRLVQQQPDYDLRYPIQQQMGHNHDATLRQDAMDRLLGSPLVKDSMTRWVNPQNGHSGILMINNTTYKKKCDRNCIRINETTFVQGKKTSSEYWLCNTGTEWVYRQARGLPGRLVGGCL